MDYTKSPIGFKLLKVLKYLRIFGFTRTFNKVKSAYHMKKTYDVLPEIKAKNKSAHVGIIGCGNFSYSTIAYYLNKNFGAIISGAMDKNLERAASLCKSFKGNYYTDNADLILEDESIDIVYIASNHATHAEFAIKALNKGKSVHIEKPPVVSYDQLNRLCNAMLQSNGSVGLGYNRPQSPLGKKIQDAIDDQSGPMMINWFIAAHELEDDHWYFSPEEGGRVLGNLCHWIDYTLSIIPKESRFPVKITPATSNNFQNDFVVSYEFADGSLAVITMSAKGHTFEGVSERLNIHRGNVLINMSDFHTLTVKNLNRTTNYKPLYRDHGHEGAITRSYLSRPQNKKRQNTGIAIKDFWESANLMLKTKDAIEQSKVIIANSYSSIELRE